jgi:hypothetical protein
LTGLAAVTVAKGTVHIADIGDFYVDPGVHTLHLLFSAIILKILQSDNPYGTVINKVVEKKQSG